jgi:hypothetical protein
VSGGARALGPAAALALLAALGGGSLARLSAQAPAAPANNAAPTALGPAVGYFEASADLGSPAITGSTSYDAATQTYTLAAGGTNMWGARDEFQFAWRKMNGDFPSAPT